MSGQNWFQPDKWPVCRQKLFTALTMNITYGTPSYMHFSGLHIMEESNLQVLGIHIIEVSVQIMPSIYENICSDLFPQISSVLRMSMNKYLNIFSCQMEDNIEFMILLIYFARQQIFWKLGNTNFSWGTFSHVTKCVYAKTFDGLYYGIFSFWWLTLRLCSTENLWISYSDMSFHWENRILDAPLLRENFSRLLI